MTRQALQARRRRQRLSYCRIVVVKKRNFCGVRAQVAKGTRLADTSPTSRRHLADTSPTLCAAASARARSRCRARTSAGARCCPPPPLRRRAQRRRYGVGPCHAPQCRRRHTQHTAGAHVRGAAGAACSEALKEADVRCATAFVFPIDAGYSHHHRSTTTQRHDASEEEDREDDLRQHFSIANGCAAVYQHVCGSRNFIAGTSLLSANASALPAPVRR